MAARPEWLRWLLCCSLTYDEYARSAATEAEKMSEGHRADGVHDKSLCLAAALPSGRSLIFEMRSKSRTRDDDARSHRRRISRFRRRRANAEIAVAPDGNLFFGGPKNKTNAACEEAIRVVGAWAADLAEACETKPVESTLCTAPPVVASVPQGPVSDPFHTIRF